MLDIKELNQEYKELGERRTKFTKNVSKLFISLYSDLLDSLTNELFDITITSNYGSKFVGVTIVLYNLKNLSQEDFKECSFISFKKDKFSFNMSDINKTELNKILNSKQISILNDIVHFLYKYYFHLDIKNKIVVNESIDMIYDKLVNGEK